jgi:hypothetical protein
VIWRITVACLILSTGIADAQVSEKWVNVLPDGNVQLEPSGPELDARHFRLALIEMKRKTPQLVFHLNVRSEDAFNHVPSVTKQIKAAGFDWPDID